MTTCTASSCWTTHCHCNRWQGEVVDQQSMTGFCQRTAPICYQKTRTTHLPQLHNSWREIYTSPSFGTFRKHRFKKNSKDVKNAFKLYNVHQVCSCIDRAMEITTWRNFKTNFFLWKLVEWGGKTVLGFLPSQWHDSGCLITPQDPKCLINSLLSAC